MFHFVRRLRRKLLNEGHMNRYILYALGEILLVVLGILIALQINVWNQDRLDLQSERFYLYQMLEELEADHKSLKLEWNRYNKKPAKIKHFVDQLYAENNRKAFQIAFSDFINKVVGIPSFRPNTSTFDELKSSGNLDLLQNKKLGNQIVKLYNNYDFIAQRIHDNIEFIRPMDLELMHNHRAVKFLDPQKPIFEEYNAQSDIYEFKKLKGFLESLAGNHNWTAWELTPLFEEQLDEIEQVMASIKEELNNQ